MIALKIFLVLYLAVGFAYAVYIGIKGSDKVWWFPVNMLLGPILVVYIIITSLRGKKLPVDWW